jgi:hypothetical protein
MRDFIFFRGVGGKRIRKPVECYFGGWINGKLKSKKKLFFTKEIKIKN